MVDQRAEWESLAFLVPRGELGDWRMVLLYDAAVDTGMMAALPSSPAELAAELSIEEHGARVVLEALALWDIVEAGPEGTYVVGPSAPGIDAAAVARHHARAIRNWSTIPARLRGELTSGSGADIGAAEIMLDALAVMGRQSAPGAVDACLEQVPDARRVLDLGGGHGAFAVEFARRGLRVTMQDRPEVIELARRKGWLAGSDVELFAGDLFTTVPDETFDLVFCAGVVYTFDRERNLALFRRVLPLVGPGGRLAVHTFPAWHRRVGHALRGPDAGRPRRRQPRPGRHSKLARTQRVRLFGLAPLGATAGVDDLRLARSDMIRSLRAL